MVNITKKKLESDNELKKKIEFINNLYDKDILDDSEIDIIQSNKNIDKMMILNDKYVKIIRS